jgi:dihydrofolate synthase/folylpolyglutamate synthase
VLAELGRAGEADSAIRQGLGEVRWPGRLQVLRERPWLVLDGAHNGDSAQRLAEALGECFEAGRRHLVLGTSVGKDVDRMLDALLPVVSTVTLTRSHHERSIALDRLTQALEARGVPTTTVPEVREAVGQALAQAGSDDLVIVTGSLFVVGEALEAYGPDQEGAP